MCAGANRIVSTVEGPPSGMHDNTYKRRRQQEVRHERARISGFASCRIAADVKIEELEKRTVDLDEDPPERIEQHDVRAYFFEHSPNYMYVFKSRRSIHGGKHMHSYSES